MPDDRGTQVGITHLEKRKGFGASADCCSLLLHAGREYVVVAAVNELGHERGSRAQHQTRARALDPSCPPSCIGALARFHPWIPEPIRHESAIMQDLGQKQVRRVRGSGPAFRSARRGCSARHAPRWIRPTGFKQQAKRSVEEVGVGLSSSML